MRPTTPAPPAPHHPYTQLVRAELGDIITLPEGRQLTVRAIERALSVAVGSMYGFLLGGEVGPQATLISTPGNPDAPITLYCPVDDIPAYARAATMRCEGVVSYWAPHLPNLSGALGELGYRVFSVRGHIDPMVILWRGAERVVFIKSATTTAAELRFACMPRDAGATEVDQTRYAARVGQTTSVPVPVEPQRIGAGRVERFIRRG
jgi:hypothetical protein